MAAEDAAKLVEFIAKSLVTKPDEVSVSVADGGRVLELETAAEDRGRVIGRQGRIENAGIVGADGQIDRGI